MSVAEGAKFTGWQGLRSRGISAKKPPLAPASFS
ncbi:hypothetical protein J2X05_003631 [Cellvibrio fibrivorans]|uniref:Uncharacterized protein n=1 Tax=Cellvibrio fibrivorans TaxID=126350 RepID=A0ABU1V2C5_9GAMM|nr:hypothetical protein [Cellvibrio fibrivorans]